MCFRPPTFTKLMTKCPQCNVFNPPANKTCKKCGAELPEPEAEENAAGPAGPQRAPQRAPQKPEKPDSNKE
ncbi:hypothetical protein [Desulfitobacterium hafniense]|uniref:NarG-like domain n=3 Tax=root TaxID=1 RepID=A0A098B0K1_DESHA|nr:hypothetical protein [Desulfitobacterium hafniense]ACL20538.1 hypothetical protein Dhaf_2510 [Desulfitobacterium hafniense DCB-2]KTE91447.1 hypothetical protein AT727_22255 [Desulfitobacterium hafniense]CDX01401.1 NarG-like domain [Desulfitobacterium hafniense]